MIASLQQHPNCTPDKKQPLRGFDTQTFRLAVVQFDQAAEALELDYNLHARLKFPKRSLIVSVPGRMDDDRVEV
ncbi:MAG: hypothetical protein SCG73_04065 [Nitrospiraceae bacterium]|jgi:glutamate dehydrogenase (NAD(P)+)|nr:hypothetical protein [Nitrospiraceae bacterium]